MSWCTLNVLILIFTSQVRFIGDSMLRYHIAPRPSDPDAQYPRSFKRVYNDFHPGKDIEFVTNVIKQQTTDDTIDYVILLVGTNNLTRRDISLLSFKSKYRLLLESVLAKYPKAAVICCRMFPRCDRRLTYSPQLINSGITLAEKDLASSRVHVLPHTVLDAFSTRRHLAADGLHLSFAGNSFFRKVVKGALSEYPPPSFLSSQLPFELL